MVISDDGNVHRVFMVVVAAVVVGCGGASVGAGSEGGVATGTADSDTGSESGLSTTNRDSTGTTSSPIDSTSSDGTEDGPPVIFDLPTPDMPPGGQTSCEPGDEMDALGSCREQAPPESFTPEQQWQWLGQGNDTIIAVAPLVANLTDDNGDGDIDLCDVPDVVVVAAPNWQTPGHIYVFDGATGALHYSTTESVVSLVTPALGDIDGDGIPEIVSVTGSSLVAFEHDGSLKWQGIPGIVTQATHVAVGMADVDNDGNVEIYVDDHLFDHHGNLLWTAHAQMLGISATAAADLDGDGDIEIVLGSETYEHDGTLMWSTALLPGFPHVADLDDDGLPEVLLTNTEGLSLIEHDGTVTLQDVRPTGAPGGIWGMANWMRPVAIHDFDGDGQPEIGTSTTDEFTVYETDFSLLWMSPVDDGSGLSAGTAFDFLGDGDAEAMFADQDFMHVFDITGGALFQTVRNSSTAIDYPVVADVDNDGSAEILVISDVTGGPGGSPPLQVIRDVDDRWVQARRIWNQHTYHVTNVREDGTIPQFEPPSWDVLNTYRTNAQIEGGDVCVPDPKIPD